VHVLGFTSEDDLLLAESEGQFSLDEWDEVVKAAQEVCLQSPDEMSVDEGESAVDYAKSVDMKQFIRTVMASKVAADLHWKISV
jgi:exosome complex component RRP46